MKYQYVTGGYNGKLQSIDAWCRSEGGKKELLHIMGFSPYMYIPESMPVPTGTEWIEDVIDGFNFFDGSKVKKIVVTDPLKVRDHREEFKVPVYKIPHEAKIKFVQRGMIDWGVKSVFETDVRGGVIPYTELKPVNEVWLPVVVFMDIEVKARVRFPNVQNPIYAVISVSFWDSVSQIYVTIMFDSLVNEIERRVVGNWIQIRVPTLEILVDLTNGYVRRKMGDVISGWNIGFDISYYNAWVEKAFDKSKRLPLAGYEIFDLLGAYKKLRPSLGNRLKEVVVKEGIVKSKDMVAKEFHIELYENVATRPRFMLYNKMDVEYCVKLDRGFNHIETGEWTNYNMINNFWGQKNFAGLWDINDALSHTRRHDVLWLRKAHELGIVLPSSPSGKRKSGLELGGVVFTPPPGLYPNLTVLDMSRYYPTILLTFAKETSPDVWGKLGPAVIGDLYAERDRWDKELQECVPGTSKYFVVLATQTMVKHFLSGAWGYFVYPGSRVYNPEKGDFVLGKAGEGLNLLRKGASSMGYDTKYGDTDAIFIEAEMDKVPELVVFLNGILHDWAQDMGVAPRFRVKEDRYANNTLFIRSEERRDIGVKKRYGQWVVRESGRPCNYILVKGFEYVRGNTSEITRGVQWKVLEAVLRSGIEGLVEYLKEEVKKIKSGVYDVDDITIPVNLGMRVDEAKSGEYYFGARYNNKHIGEEIIGGDRVRFFKVKEMPRDTKEVVIDGEKRVIRKYPYPQEGGGGWVSYIDKWNLPKEIEIDYDWLIDRTVRSPIERMLEAVGIMWVNVLGAHDARGYFR